MRQAGVASRDQRVSGGRGKPAAAPEQHGHQVDLDLIQHPRLECELRGGSSATHRRPGGRHCGVLSAIAPRVAAQKTVESHIRSIFRKLDIPASRSDNRRAHAVLTFLGR
jgi:hypothetical protein